VGGDRSAVRNASILPAARASSPGPSVSNPTSFGLLTFWTRSMPGIASVPFRYDSTVQLVHVPIDFPSRSAGILAFDAIGTRKRWGT